MAKSELVSKYFSQRTTITKASTVSVLAVEPLKSMCEVDLSTVLDSEWNQLILS